MNNKSSPAYTISSKFQEKVNPNAPGPLSYQIKDTLTKINGPKATIGKQKRKDILKQQGPSPADYNINYNSKPNINVIFSKSRSQQNLTRDISAKLGPGVYHPEFQKILRKTASNSKFNKSQKNFQQSKDEKGPNFFTYNPKTDFVFRRESRAIFGSAKRHHNTHQKITPGPGQYSSQNCKINSSRGISTFSHQKRCNEKGNDFPGPLSYTIESQFDKNVKNKKGFKLRFKKDQHEVLTPGPTSYHSEKILKWKSAPKFSIPKEPKKSSIASSTSIPPPKFYNTASTFRPQSSNALIASQKRQFDRKLAKNTIPGPDHYSKVVQNKAIGSGIKFSIPKSRFSGKLIEKRPGPWSYCPMDVMKSVLKSVSIGREKTETQKKIVISPGPGEYTIPQQTVPGMIMGKDKRDKTKVNETPGPNTYNIPSLVANLPYYEKVKGK